MSLTGFGAIAGLPLAVAGAVVGSVGGLTVSGGIMRETLVKNKQLQSASKHLQAHYFHSMQLRILIGRSTTTSAALAKVTAAGVARATGTVGLHIRGIVISALLIPVDLIQLIVSSVNLDLRSKSEVVINTEKIADDLENELWFLLKDKSYTLAQLERFDDERQKQMLFIAGERNSVEEVSANSNYSLKEVYANQIIIADFIGEEIDPVLCEKLLTKWNDVENDVESKSFDVLSLTEVF